MNMNTRITVFIRVALATSDITGSDAHPNTDTDANADVCVSREGTSDGGYGEKCEHKCKAHHEVRVW